MLKQIPLLDDMYFGNTLGEWLIAIAIVIGAFLVGKILMWTCGKFLKRMAKRTTTRIDDLFVDMVEEPLVFAITVFGIWLGLTTLNFSAEIQSVVDNVLYLLITMAAAWVLVRFVDALVHEYLTPKAEASDTDLDDQLLPILRKGIKVSIWFLALMMAASNAGYDIMTILAGLGIGGLALALAAQDTVKNLFGGVTIFTDKPFKLNDRVKISGFDGSIREIGLRSTRLETLEGRMVTIPNSKFTDNPTENISSEPNRKVVVQLGLTYDTDAAKMQKAMDVLLEISNNNPDTEEKVLTGFTGFGDFALQITYIYYIKKDSDILATQTAMNMEILKKFAENGLEFAFPTQTIYTAQP